MVNNMNGEWMNLQHLSYALEVEKTGSISKAAENLYMNQPNLSKAIKELETMIGVPLFKRTTKGVSSTTEEGRIFLEYAKNILSQFEEMKAHFQTASLNRPTFSISVPRASYIAEAFASFINAIESRDNFNVIFQETNFLQAIKSVTDDGYNLAIIRYRTKYEKFFLSFLVEKELAHEEILESENVIIMSAKNKLADKDSLEFSDLEDMIEITNNDFALPHQLSSDKPRTDDILRCKKQILVYERGSQFDLLSHNHNTFMRVSPMPKDVLERNCLVQKRFGNQDIRFKDVLIYRKGYAFGEYEQIFLDHLECVKDSILKF